MESGRVGSRQVERIIGRIEESGSSRCRDHQGVEEKRGVGRIEESCEQNWNNL